MEIKIRGATSIHDENSLCASCRHSTITRGHRLDEEIVVCNASHVQARQITFKVSSCSHYDDQRLPSYYEFMQQAWILQPGSQRRGAGFVRAADLRDEDLHDFLAAMRKHSDV
jgi:hypothetical protein